MLFFNNLNNSLIKALDVPYVWQKFKISNVVHKFESFEFFYKGTFDASSISYPFANTTHHART
jgi:hypothetical protein